VDECAGLDALVTTASGHLGYDPETTLHDVRYGESYPVNGAGEFVWVFEISGAVPPKHSLASMRARSASGQPAIISVSAAEP